MLKNLAIKRVTRPLAAPAAALLLVGGTTLSSGTASHLCQPAKVGPVLDFSTGAAEGVALSLDGEVFVGNTNTGDIWRVPRAKGTQGSLFVDLLESEGPLNFLLGLDVAPDGTLYAAVNALLDPAVHGLWRVDPDGTASRVAAAPAFFASALNDIARDPQGNLYVTDSLPGEIWRLTPAGEFDLWSTSELLRGGFFPQLGVDFGVNGLAYYAGALYGGVTLSGRIVRVPIGPDGNAGTPAIVSEADALIGVDGVELDALGNIYVGNAFSNVVQRIRTSDGNIETVVDGVSLSAPASLALSANQRTLYVANLSTSAVIPQPHAPALMKFEFQLPVVSSACAHAR